MTPESANRIRESFRQLAPQLERMTRDFYDRMFAARPETRALFGRDMTMQQQHLGAALALIVRNLSMLDALAGTFQQLGAAHARAGVRPEHYPVVRDAMLESMSAALNPMNAWSAELLADWRALLDQVAAYMLQGGLSAIASGINARM
jgi:hemoglobin-like flavoprotein